MKALKIVTLWIVIGLAVLVQLISTTSAHAGGIKTPLSPFTPDRIGTPRIPGIPTIIQLTKNTAAATTMDPSDQTPNVTPNTVPPNATNQPASTPTVTPLKANTESLSQQATAQITSTALPLNTATVSLQSETLSPISI